MPWSIHHVNLQARDVRKTAAFYTTILGMEQKPWAFPQSRGYLPGDPDKLALLADNRDSHSGLHLIAPDDDFAAKNNMQHNPSKGGHVAFQVDDLDAVMQRLTDAGIPFSATGEFAIPGLRHVYVNDPEGNLIEINGCVGPAPTPVRHIVLCQIKADTPQSRLDALWHDLDALRAVIPGMRAFKAAPNTSPEPLGRGYTHAFTVDFDDAAARDAYLTHPDHQAIGDRLVALCEGGRDGLCVVDL